MPPLSKENLFSLCLSSLDRRSENAFLLAIIVPELEFGNRGGNRWAGYHLRPSPVQLDQPRVHRLASGVWYTVRQDWWAWETTGEPGSPLSLGLSPKSV